MSSRLRSRLTWQKADVPRAKAALSGRQVPDDAHEKAGFQMPIAPREEAIVRLHLGAEIEHALMVQYLYAAYSLNENQDTDEHRTLVKKWKASILEVAREEMGHLATVQNILTLIGGPLCFDREDYPIIDPELWPFPFELEPLTKNSLAKYVLAEMPSEDVLKKLGIAEEIEEIKLRLMYSEQLRVNRVGEIYREIIELFNAPPFVEGPAVPGADPIHTFVPTVDIQPDSVPYQVSASAWGLGYKEILIEVAHDRKSAIAGLSKVSVQGEGPMTADDEHLPVEYAGSHFRRFLDIYREFPEPSQWKPARDVATNPTTNPTTCKAINMCDAGPSASLIQGEAVPWASLANLRYRMLLMYLEHSFYIEAPTTHPTRSPRGALVTWVFGEMYNLRSLSEILMSMPLGPGSTTFAGPPFEMPYSLSLATRPVNRWRAHRDLLLASIQLIDTMLKPSDTKDKPGDTKDKPEPVHARYLRALRSADKTALDQIEALIGA